MRWLAFLLLAGCSAQGTGGREPAGSGVTTLTVVGSTVLVPLLTEAANSYMKSHAGVVIEVSAGGSKVGLTQVSTGAATIGASDVAADFEQSKLLEDHRVAVVGFAVVAGRGAWNEPVKSLSHEQIRGLFSGGLRDWSAVGGREKPVVIINRKPSSGTRAVFRQIMLDGTDFVLSEEVDSSTAVQDLVIARPGAISYLGLPYGRPELRNFAIDGVEPTVENIEHGRYPLWSFEHLYTRRPTPPAAQQFVDYVTAADFQKELPRLGFIPVDQMKPRDRDPRY
jgi:phosphate transport system substrate-binding protein